MALDLSGIENVEFYSGHYLDAVLEGDLKKAVFNKWAAAKKEDGIRPPWETLAALAGRYFTACARAEEERDEVERWRHARDFHAYLLEALGYLYRPSEEPLDKGEVCPVLLSLRRDGRPFLWVVDAPFTAAEDDDPLAARPLRAQVTSDDETLVLPFASWRELLDERVFRLDAAPRWILFLAGRELLLIERAKWPQGKYLRFLLSDLFRRRKARGLKAMAGLLHRDVLAPEAGICLHDTLDESSHKHAYAVSGDLKHGVRRAVELLANEAVYYRREVQKRAVFSDEEFAGKLTSESLTWLYRLLFVFYVEARGAELGVVPMGSEAYRKGYSLETLRDLELVPLTTEHARNGTFLHDSLRLLFRIMNQGFPAEGQASLGFDGANHDTMVLAPLNSPLFDDERLKVLRGVKFRNFVLQEVLQLLSLSAEKKRKSRGRISYAQLGINQLGAVYEGLLSYTGFFATEDLYEVASEKDCKKLSGKPAAEREALKTYFVPASKIGDYREGEIVRDESGKPVIHPRGDFIFRLAGRNREKSASYYTPEVLTRCLVKYALKELLWEEGEDGGKPKRKKTADEILALTICEPAMGSSAFLIEAVDQLADAYLEARQEELGKEIPPEDYQREKRRVKARLATNNCYGVDLNPTAVELAKVSLWLATLHEGGKCPWFGLRLATGNSLVGARREVFKAADIVRKGTKDNRNWLGLVPEPVPLYHGPDGPPLDEHWTPPPRPKGTIYHFLLPALGMAAFDKDKVIKELAPEEVRRIKEWRKEFCRPFGTRDAERLESISDAVDRLFAQVVRERMLAVRETSDRIPVWGEPPSAHQADLLVRDQEEVAASLEEGSSAYRRLKLAMDAWCALWFWPIEEAGLLPDRATWLAQMELILKGQVTHEDVWQQQQTLFTQLSPTLQRKLMTSEIQPADVAPLQEASAGRLMRLRELSDAFRDRRANYSDECGLADIDTVLDSANALRAAQGIADRLQFHHWPLRFAEVFACRGGFDLVLGNPPWVTLRWKEGELLSEFLPILDIRKVRASDVASARAGQISESSVRSAYMGEFVGMNGGQSYLGSRSNYDLLEGVQTNSYKCFIVIGWQIGCPDGIIAHLFPEGVYDDPYGGTLREAIYSCLVLHAQFINELSLFPEIGHPNKFGVNVLRTRPQRDVKAVSVSNLFHPSTIDESFLHDGLGEVPGIKDQAGGWEVRGHRDRIVALNEERLRLFAQLYDEPGTSARRARLPLIHTEQIVNVVKCFAAQPTKLSARSDAYIATAHWHETGAQKDGTIRRETEFPESPSELILSGPHFFTATPLNKTPNEGCRSHGDYTSIDLATVKADYLPRTNYTRACEPGLYSSRMPKWRGRPVTDFYRIVFRAMLNVNAERTLGTALYTPGPGHINGVKSYSFADGDWALFLAGLWSSIPIDFYVRIAGKTNLHDIPESFPCDILDLELRQLIQFRGLLLNAVGPWYDSLWDSWVQSGPRTDAFTFVDRRLGKLDKRLTAWAPESALRSDLERRLALVELDVLSAEALGIALVDLLTIYRVHFGVLQQHERERLYDQYGRIVPTSKTASGNPAVNLVELAANLKEQAGFDIHAEYHPGASNTQELRKQSLRLGKKEATVLGVPERCTMDDLLAETEVRWSDDEHPEGRLVPLVGLRYTDPGLEPRMERVYPTPWTRCDREADYRQAWAEFERRLGKRMPEGTPL